MREKLHHLHILAACLVLQLGTVACSEDLKTDSQAERPILLTASGICPEQVTRSVSDMHLQDTYFLGGIQLPVWMTAYMGDANTPKVVGGNPETYTTSAASGGVNTLSTGNKIIYPDIDTRSIDIFSLYPFTAKDSTEHFSVKYPQLSDEDYLGSDLMVSPKTNYVASDQAINLEFNHLMAKFIITVTGEEAVGIQTVTLKNVYRATQFDPSTGEIPKNATPSDQGDLLIIDNSDGAKAQKQTACLLPPQTVAGDLVVVTTDKGDATFALTAPRALASGKEYTMNLTVGRKAIGYTSTITAWDSDAGAMAVASPSGNGFKIKDIPSEQYNKAAHTPALEVRFGNMAKDFGVEDNPVDASNYNVQYFNNVNVGTATAIVIGATSTYNNMAAAKSFIITQAEGKLLYPGGPKGTKTVTWSPNPGKQTVNHTLQVTGDDEIPIRYNSGDDKVATVSSGGTVIMVGHGTTTISASMQGSGNYTAADDEYTLVVNRYELKDADVSLAQTSYYFSGEECRPAVVVRVDDQNLEDNNTCYTVSYSDNTAVGTAKVTVIGVGNYQGTIVKEFTISKASAGLVMASGDVVNIPVGSTYTRSATSERGTVRYKSSDDAVASVSATGVVTGLTAGKSATITAYVDGTDDYIGDSKSYTVNVVATETNFTYENNKIYEFTPTVTGTYKLEVWGAGGGAYTGWSWGRWNNGSSNGGYATGRTTLNAGTTYYIVVGGEGGPSSSRNSAGTAGYNGGGAGGNGGGGGGGATHIATQRGLLQNISASSVLIVAGGAGGSVSGGKGGAGGGTTGGSASYVYGEGKLEGGSQSAGNQFGLGGNGASGSAGGGGGYYGGRAQSTNNQASPGSGGSGYIGSLSNSRMNNGTNSGNGKAKITWLP